MASVDWRGAPPAAVLIQRIAWRLREPSECWPPQPRWGIRALCWAPGLRAEMWILAVLRACRGSDAACDPADYACEATLNEVEHGSDWLVDGLEEVRLHLGDEF
jgi:hypothetical protein